MTFWKSSQEQESKSNFNNISFPLEQRNYDSFVYYLDIFSPSECKSIIEFCKGKKPLDKATVGLDNNNIQNKSVRNSNVAFFERSEETEWIFLRLFDVLKDCNDKWYNFDVRNFGEGFQFTEYEQGMFYKWHQDYGPWNFSNRKISMVLNLTDATEYEGGELEFFSLPDAKTPKSIGSVIAFPSFESHCVKPITSGTRYSLVSWVQGPPFR